MPKDQATYDDILGMEHRLTKMCSTKTSLDAIRDRDPSLHKVKISSSLHLLPFPRGDPLKKNPFSLLALKGLSQSLEFLRIQA